MANVLQVIARKLIFDNLLLLLSRPIMHDYLIATPQAERVSIWRIELKLKYSWDAVPTIGKNGVGELVN